ncbi:winged helix DNA-binding protein [Novosphingobium sp. Gsoil 351]|nr:winged helix DNA-binding protein [Novosphingobium sp. Gsoil 351]
MLSGGKKSAHGFTIAMTRFGGEKPVNDRSRVRADDPPGMLLSLRTLARAMLALTDPAAARADAPQLTSERRQWGALARSLHHERARRANFLPPELFGEPGWDILLDLAFAAQANEPRSIKSACLSSHVPEATALRYIDLLIRLGLVERTADKIDRRRKFVRLTELGERNMRDYLASMPPIGDQGEDLIRYLAQLG